MHYYDLKANWHRVEPHLGDEQLNALLVRNSNFYTMGLWGKRFRSGQLPLEFEPDPALLGADKPAYFSYVKRGACHWLVNFTLRLAQLVEPDRAWRIISSDKHSTVWDGESMLFDFNYQAFGVSPERCFQEAHVRVTGTYQFVECGLAEVKPGDPIPTMAVSARDELRRRFYEAAAAKAKQKAA